MANKDLKYYEALPYRIILYFDQEDRAWFASYPELPGCLADGDTKEEAMANGEEAKSLWLETALKYGDPIPEPRPDPPYSGKFVLRLPKSLHERATQAAEKEGVSLNQYLNSIIADRLGANALLAQLIEKVQQPWMRFFTNTTMLTSVVNEKSDIVYLNQGSYLFATAEVPPLSCETIWGEKQNRPEGEHG